MYCAILRNYSRVTVEVNVLRLKILCIELRIQSQHFVTIKYTYMKKMSAEAVPSPFKKNFR